MVGKNMKNNKVETGKNEETTDKRIEETTDKRIEERLTNEDDICKNGKQVKVENVSVQIVKGKIENGLLDNSGCFLCGIKAETSCPRCGVEACSIHLSQHNGVQEGDEVVCLPFRVVWRENVGRCVLATRDIQPLELILQDKPVVLGPNYETEAVCVNCLGRVDGTCICEHCNLLFCGETCKKSYETSLQDNSSATTGVLHATECAAFSQMEKKFCVENVAPGTVAYEYGSITVLRLLSLRDSAPAEWARLQVLMDHDEERRKEEVYWNMFQVNIVDFLRKRCKQADKYSEEEIHWAIGILRTNAANVERPYMARQGTSGKAIYPTFSFFSHSCICNARYIIRPDDTMDLRAQVPIRQGEEITIQYISFLFGNVRRRTDIKNCWLFECQCVRCQDVTELGTFVSALLCPKCEGSVLPKSSSLDESEWECIKCKNIIPDSEAIQIFSKLEKTMFDTFDTDVAKYEALLEEYRKILHPNHFQILLLEKYLAEALKGQLSLGQIELKVKLLKHFIEVFSLLDPGKTSWKAKTQFEVCRTRLFLADIQHSNNLIAKPEFIQILEENITDLTDIVQTLGLESHQSKEFQIFKQASVALASAKDILLFATMLP